jgi:NAD(P)-dependent dehydrogenase (short-subunit alcohol dehydrogenase family)
VYTIDYMQWRHYVTKLFGNRLLANSMRRGRETFAAYEDDRKLALKNIVMTGATSGIGYVAAQRLIAEGHSLTVGVRDGKVLTGCLAIALDLSDLSSVRAFADQIKGPINVLVLNAGVQNQNVACRTVQGSELTFGVNHLAHYLLARLLLEKLSENGRIVLTSSGTHDPEDKTGMPAPRHANAQWLANPEKDKMLDANSRIAGLRAYASSKLCNLMTARSLAQLPIIIERGIEVLAYDPGLTPGTGLARNAPFFIRYIAMPILPILSPFIKFMNTLDNAGTTLAKITNGAINRQGVYLALRRGKPTWPNPSKLALDDQAANQLWNDSAALVGLHVN